MISAHSLLTLTIFVNNPPRLWRPELPRFQSLAIADFTDSLVDNAKGRRQGELCFLSYSYVTPRAIPLWLPQLVTPTRALRWFPSSPSCASD